jgi:hypothetical protein
MANKWEVVDEDSGTLTAEYSFKPGSTARCLVTRVADGELAIISAPCGFSDEDYEPLRKLGEVTSIVAPNGLHWLGVEPTLAAFPKAKVYAPELAAKRIKKRLPNVEFHPLSDLQGSLTNGVRVVEVPGFKIGETWMTVSTEKGPIWYVSDSCFSMPRLPTNWFVSKALTWTKSAPGFRLNGLANLIFLKDKPAYRSWFLEQLENQPRVVVTAHGDVVQAPFLGKSMWLMVVTRL